MSEQRIDNEKENILGRLAEEEETKLITGFFPNARERANVLRVDLMSSYVRRRIIIFLMLNDA